MRLSHSALCVSPTAVGVHCPFANHKRRGSLCLPRYPFLASVNPKPLCSLRTAEIRRRFIFDDQKFVRSSKYQVKQTSVASCYRELEPPCVFVVIFHDRDIHNEKASWISLT